MTPKEKAKELIDKFNFSIDHNTKVYTIYQIPDESKRCALIAVDEVIDAYQYLNVEVLHTEFGEILDKINGEIRIKYAEFVMYWQQVKQEIVNL